MNDALQQVASFATSTEAEQLRVELEADGIRVFVDGANTNTMLAYVGSALGGYRVMVRAEDAARAAELIQSVRTASSSSAKAWYCGRCRVEVDAGYDSCWSCGEAQAIVEKPFPAATEETQENDEHETEGLAINAEAEALLRNAWRASVIGLVFFPLLTHLYSMRLLRRAVAMTSEFSADGVHLYRRTYVLNMVAIYLFGTLGVMLWVRGWS